MKEFSKLAVASVVALAFSGGANAALTDQYLNVGMGAAGNNVLEDDSGEYVFRDNGTGVPGPAGYDLVSGPIAVGDYFLGFLDIPLINGHDLGADGNEFTGLFLSRLTSITDVGTSTAVGSTIFPDNYASATLAFDAADFSVWGDLFGVNLTTLGAGVGADLTGSFAIFYEDNANEVDVFTQDFATTLANTVNGTFVLAGGFDNTAATFNVATDSPLNNTEFDSGANPQRVAGVTQLGDFGVNNIVLYEGFNAIIDSNLLGSGTNLVTALDFHPVQDDTQFSFHAMPEPSSFALIGLGLLGMSVAQKRRKV